MIAPLSADIRSVDLELPLGEAFDKIASVHATHIAVDTGQRQISYEKLKAAAEALADSLIDSGAAPSDRVAVLMAHDVPAIAALVGVAKMGGVALGLNCSDPPARLRQLLDDAEPLVLVTDAENLQLATELAASRLAVLVFDAEGGGRHGRPLPRVAGGGATAALVYTSGTTGRPKGVMKTHRQISRNVAAHSEAMVYTAADRIPLFSSIGTGQGTTVVWCALLNGATLCPFAIRTRGFAGLARWISAISLTVFVSSASILRSLVKSLDADIVFDGIRAVRLASESVTTEDLAAARRHFASDCVFVHTLSSSETGNIAWSRWRASDQIPGGRLPVGRISRDIHVSLLDEDGHPVGAGEIGEIAVRSRYAAAGYWRDPELTAARFSPPLDDAGTRLVRSGDLGCLGPDGQLELRGRKDDRVKIRGNRIELSDVERVLGRIPGIAEVAAVAVQREGGEPLLVAYLVRLPGNTLSTRQIRHLAAVNLPHQMLPSRFVFLDRLPLGASGKIDREQLRAHGLPGRQKGEAPRGATETAMAHIWAEALDVPDIGREDDFFEAGGDSLKAAIVSAHVHAAYGVAVSLAALAANPTVAALTAYVDARPAEEALPPIVRVPRSRPLPLSPYQERVWHALRVLQRHATVARTYEISGPLDRAAMERSFSLLTARHEMFRTTFSVVDGQPAQTVHPVGPSGFSFVDVSFEPNPEVSAERFCESEAIKPIDASVLPTTRLVLIRLGAEKHWLLRVGHVLSQDPSSFAMVMNEFAALYEAEVRGLPPPIPATLPLQYVDFALWHREIMRPDGRVYQSSLDWWKRTFAKRIRTTRLPFRERRAAGDVAQASLGWRIDGAAAERLEAFARRAGATHFVIRLACFAALLAEAGGRSTVVIATGFTSRPGDATASIAGLFTNLAPLVIPYRREFTLTEWVRHVRDHVFETERHAHVPLETLYDDLRRSGLRPPPIKALFTMRSDWPEQSFGGITLRRRSHPLPEMPWGFQVFVDQRVVENCRIEFNAERYQASDVAAFAATYVRLLEAAASEPALAIGELVVGARGSSGGLLSRLRLAFGQVA